MAAPDTPDENSVPGTWPERNYRALKAAVIIMGVLIVLGLIVIFATIVNRMSAGGSSSSSATPVATVVPENIAVLFGPEAEVVSTALDGSRLAVVLKRPDGHTVIVVDLRSGNILNVIGAGAAR